MGAWEEKQKSGWRSKRNKYNAEAFARTTHPHPRPPFFHHLFSGGWANGVRYWAFESVRMRDAFIEANKDRHKFAVEACDDPLKPLPIVEDEDDALS